MAINKTVNQSAKSHGAMRNCIEYVLKEQKISDGLVYMTGPAPDEISRDAVYQAFLEEKQLWNKDTGRMYNHNIISFHMDENITPKQAFDFGKEFAETWFPDHQTLIAVHQDREHTHIHLVTNTVSYKDGRKLHNSRTDLQRMKDLTNRMCEERNLQIAEKGKHFDGTEIDAGEIIAWSKDKYNLAANAKKKSYLADCAIAISQVLENGCCSREEFIAQMEQHGWTTTWKDSRKHITFRNADGNKVRDSNLSKTFTMNINKEALSGEFERQNEIRLSGIRAEQDRFDRNLAEAEQYYQGVESAITRAGAPAETNRSDTAAFLGELDAQERTSEEKREDRLAERNDRELRQARSRSRGLSR